MAKTQSKHLLVVEDDKGLQSQLRWAFDGYEVAIAGDRSEAIAALRRFEPGVVLLDLGLPPDPGGVTEGLATLREVLSLAPETKVIVVTGDNDRANAVKAIAGGAWDFHQKPADPELLAMLVDRAYHVYALERENLRLQKASENMPLRDIIAVSPEMLKVCRTVEKIAPTDITTLLLGASGTGKERFARALHELSPRAGKRMVAINCAAIPENLLESELFGYEKGAFTGANQQTIGKIEYANEGTLFLDEIGDLPLELQAKLLAVLEEGKIRRVGSAKESTIRVRVLAATNRDLEKCVAEGTFREDLLYRINAFTIRLPSLRDRGEDAVLIAQNLTDRLRREYGMSAIKLNETARRMIAAHQWPGNVRELFNVIQRAAMLCEGEEIKPSDLAIRARSASAEPLGAAEQFSVPGELLFDFDHGPHTAEEVERLLMLQALEHTRGNVSKAARLIGMQRSSFRYRIERYGIEAQVREIVER